MGAGRGSCPCRCQAKRGGGRLPPALLGPAPPRPAGGSVRSAPPRLMRPCARQTGAWARPPAAWGSHAALASFAGAPPFRIPQLLPPGSYPNHTTTTSPPSNLHVCLNPLTHLERACIDRCIIKQGLAVSMAITRTRMRKLGWPAVYGCCHPPAGPHNCFPTCLRASLTVARHGARLLRKAGIMAP